MPISRGEPWGSRGRLPADAPVVGTDAELAALVQEAGDRASLVVGLAGGDLCRTLGGRGDVASRRGKDATLAAVDLGTVRLDEQDPQVFAAHLVARGRAWSGPGLVVMSAEWCGDLRLAPRGHPGDGLLDVTEGALGWRDRLEARRRANTGDHLPHPSLQATRQAALTRRFSRPRRVYLDGLFVGSYRRMDIEVWPEAVLVAV